MFGATLESMSEYKNKKKRLYKMTIKGSEYPK